MNEQRLTVRTFALGTEKEAALKPLEEAAEVYAAWQECEWLDSNDAIDNLADEIADVIQAACNLAARHGIDLEDAMDRCERRNRERGRYTQAAEDTPDQSGDRGDKLAPCPKCGKKHPWYEVACCGLICRVICEGCGASVYRCTVGREGYATDEAIEAWNEGKVDE